jgi:hypothetical protein
VYGINGDSGGRLHRGQGPAIRSTELQCAIGASIDLKALFVDCAVVPAAEQREVRQGGRAALGPVADVVTLAEAHAAAGEAAAAVAMLERPA